MAEGKGFLQGNLLLKLIGLFAVILIFSIVWYGVQFTLPSIFWTIVRAVLATIFIYLVFKGIASFMAKPGFSPTRRFKDRMIRIATISKPFNVKELYIRGEDMRVYSKWGKIAGLAFIPYLSSKLKTDDNGSYIYEQKKDKNDKPIFDEDGKPVMVNAKDYLTEKDGDWFFVVKRGIPFFQQTDLVRSHKSLVSDIGEKVFIKCVNLCPVGEYFYPNQQWQTDIRRIKVQHQSEAVIETYEEFLDLIANVTQMTLNGDPNFQKILKAGTEQIGQEAQGSLVNNGQT